jgi:hypothetical protein
MPLTAPETMKYHSSRVGVPQPRDGCPRAAQSLRANAHQRVSARRRAAGGHKGRPYTSCFQSWGYGLGAR